MENHKNGHSGERHFESVIVRVQNFRLFGSEYLYNDQFTPTSTVVRVCVINELKVDVNLQDAMLINEQI